jgi:hypothetical protein
MILKINNHIELLSQYLPFDGNSQQIYAEYANPNEANPLNTQAFNYVKGLLKSWDTNIIVLTGDAGHGKTYLCRLLLEEIGYPKEESKEILLKHGDGTHLFKPKNEKGKPLRIFKDLSDPAESVAAEMLVDYMQDKSAITLICANEGKLRSVVDKRFKELQLLISTLTEGLKKGTTSIERGFYVVNLNFQSVASTQESSDSLTHQLLKNWVGDKRKWRICETCEAQGICPIYYNHNQLSGSKNKDLDAARRRDSLVAALRIAEQSGQVITIRELLILVAYLITGNLRCQNVHEKYERSKENRSWQHEYLYHQLLFSRRLTADQVTSLPMIQAMYKIDPGNVACRTIDERLSAHPEKYIEDHFPHDNPNRDSDIPKKKSELVGFSNRCQNFIRFLRRLDYFEQSSLVDESDQIPLTRRLGLDFCNEFEAIIKGDIEPSKKMEIRDALLKGIEAIQGIRRSGNTNNFSIVDSAFSNSNGEIGIIATQVLNQSVDIVSQKKLWQDAGTDSKSDLPNALDWLDRNIAIVIQQNSSKVIVIDLLQFEFIMRASRGLSCLIFFQADIRRIMAKLDSITMSDGVGSDEIRVLHGNTTKTLTIDIDNTIRCS